MVSEIITQINGPFFHGVSIVFCWENWLVFQQVPDVQAITSSGEVAEENAYLGRFLRDFCRWDPWEYLSVYIHIYIMMYMM